MIGAEGPRQRKSDAGFWERPSDKEIDHEAKSAKRHHDLDSASGTAGRDLAVKAGRNGWRLRIALAAALVLVLQSVASTLAFRPVPPPVLDIFGNVLCLAGSAASDPGDHPHQQKVLPCCATGCSSSGLSWAPSAQTDAELGSIWPDRIAAVFVAPSHPVAARLRTPANPRAPPAVN